MGATKETIDQFFAHIDTALAILEDELQDKYGKEQFITTVRILDDTWENIPDEPGSTVPLRQECYANADLLVMGLKRDGFLLFDVSMDGVGSLIHRAWVATREPPHPWRNQNGDRLEIRPEHISRRR